MTDPTQPDPHHPFAKLASEHTHEHQARQEAEELAADADTADFDLAKDIAHPTIPHSPVDFDLAKDIGIENEPPELRN